MTSRPLQILVCDDERRRAGKWADEVRTAVGGLRAEISVLHDDFAGAIADLRERRLRARGRGPSAPPSVNPIDRADILFVDYDLLRFDQVGIETGESVAYLARCYSTCGLIVTLNEFGVNSFDLTLDPHLESFADLSLGSSQLGNPGLWSGSARAGYRPWHWPLLPDAIKRHRVRVQELAGTAVRKPILKYLGFPKSATAALSSKAAEFLSSAGDINEVTFEGFARGRVGGFRRTDSPADEVAVARVAAARIAKWLELAVLPGQDVLVDAPHLARRLPSLLAGDPKRLADWDATAVLEHGGRQSGLKQRNVQGAALTATSWVSRQAWFWPIVAQDESIDEVRAPWKTARVHFEFCEDLSRFAPEEDCRPFVAALETPFAHRYVIRPRSQWAREKVGVGALAPTSVEYRPPLRFAI